MQQRPSRSNVNKHFLPPIRNVEILASLHSATEKTRFLDKPPRPNKLGVVCGRLWFWWITWAMCVYIYCTVHFTEEKKTLSTLKKENIFWEDPFLRNVEIGKKKKKIGKINLEQTWNLISPCKAGRKLWDSSYCLNSVVLNFFNALSNSCSPLWD